MKMKTRPRILVLSAFEPELTELRRLLAAPAVPRSVAAGVVCAPAGIGLPDAAAGAAAALARHRPRQVVFIGTAGSYLPTVPVGGVVVARRLHLTSAAVARGQGYLPGPLVSDAPTDADLRRSLVRAAAVAQVRTRNADVATTLAITTSPALARAFAAATGAAAENLEVFAVARAAAIAGVPFAAVLGISNRVGPRAHEEWRRHQDGAMRAVAAVVFEYLRARLRAPSR